MTPVSRNLLLTATAALALAAGCERGSAPQSTAADPSASTVEKAAPAEADDQSAKINAWFEEQFEAGVARSPMTQTFLGRKTNYDKWNDASDAFRIETFELQMAALQEMRDSFSLDALDPSARLSYRLYEYQAEQAARNFPWREHWYVFSHFTGPHSGVPSFLINQHRVSSVEDAEAYIARLNGVATYLGQHQQNAETQCAVVIICG